MPDFFKNEEKKVEYLELIYDLMFVYLIGRNNTLLGHVTDGFIAGDMYLIYVLYTLITIQIWYLTTLFINRYGENGLAEHICLFINMFLMYYMGAGTSGDWHVYFYRYNIAWALILLNLLVQYYLKYRKIPQDTPWERSHIRMFMRMLAVMIIIIAAGLLLYKFTGLPLTPAAMVAGIIFAITGRKKHDLVALDFPHLSERVMLYIVFTFGEMIIVISVYFAGDLSPRNVYFALCAYLIVVGLHLSYGFLYDKLLDRDMSVSGNLYMLLHIAIIFALSSLTTALEFMHDPEVALIPKTAMLICSFIVYYVFIFLLAPFLKGYDGRLSCFRSFGTSLIVFVILMIVTYNRPMIGIAISALMTFNIWYLEYRYWKNYVLPHEENAGS